jgi:DNA-directed RNA polymerase specialized sigma24 family protein
LTGRRQQRAWALTEGALDGLLAVLGPSRTLASVRYEQIRRKLIKFFEWRGCRFPEELADEAINRVACKIEEGLELDGESVYRYFHGVARLLAKEAIRRRCREESARALGIAAPTGGEEDRALEFRLDCLHSCMNGLTPGECELLLQYYRGEKSEKIRNRKALAEQLGIPMNALRIRVHRLREKLEHCMADCPQLRQRSEMP